MRSSSCSCCDRIGLKRGAWTSEEDRVLVSYIQKYGHGNWRALPKRAGLLRCGKSCRLRWNNYLRPDIKRGNYTLEEEEVIIKSHELLGNKWSAIAAELPGRTDNEIKNIWHTYFKKKLQNCPNSESPKKPAKSRKAVVSTNTNTIITKEGLDKKSCVQPSSSSSASPATSNEVSSSTYHVEEVMSTIFDMPIIDKSFWSIDESKNKKTFIINHAITTTSMFQEDPDRDFWLEVLFASTSGNNNIDHLF